ncbi:MAG TPA: hypothetical protein VGI39_08630 [Polyangiaceae bacterium]|jgi:hypothetical protein
MAPRSFHSMPPDGEPPPSLFARVGSLLGVAALVALVSTVPAVTRVGPATGWLAAWLGLASCSLVPALLALAVLRGAREGTRAFPEHDPPMILWAASVWAMTVFLLLTGLGALLRATTHHHGLAGVTFAVGAVVVAAGVALVVRRLTAIARGMEPWNRAALLAVLLVVLFGALAVVGIRVARSSSAVPLPSPTLVVDALAFFIAVVALSRTAFQRVPGLATIGIPLAAGVLLVGGALLSSNPELAQTIRTEAPQFAPLLPLVGSR